MTTLTPIPGPYADAIADILTETCGLGKNRADLVWTLTHTGIIEHRFMGDLGFGGKLWDNNGRWYVTCYREDNNPGRESAIKLANTMLAALRARYEGRVPPNPNEYCTARTYDLPHGITVKEIHVVWNGEIEFVLEPPAVGGEWYATHYGDAGEAAYLGTGPTPSAAIAASLRKHYGS